MNTGMQTRFRIAALAAAVALGGCALNPFDGFNAGAGRAAAPPSPDNLELARDAYRRGNYGIAIGHLERELARYEHSVAALNGLGASFDRLGRRDVARRYYYKALDLAPDSSMTLANLGFSFLLDGRPAEAEPLLRLALRHDPANEAAANHLQTARTELAQAVAVRGQGPLLQEEAVAVRRQDEIIVGGAPAREPIPPPIVRAITVEPALVREAIPPPAVRTPALYHSLRLELSNGNGVEGMAARLRGYLRNKGGQVVRLTNADTFAYERSLLFYRPGQRAAAETLQAALPLQDIELRESLALRPGLDARLVLGRDFVPHDPTISTGGLLAQR